VYIGFYCRGTRINPYYDIITTIVANETQSGVSVLWAFPSLPLKQNDKLGLFIAGQ
jgi:hypothetical protein